MFNMTEDIFEAAKADPEKKRLIQEREEAVRNYNNAISVATEEGIEQGRAEGIEQGRAEGEKQKAIETARKMLADGVPVDVVSKYTGLSPEEIDGLRV